MSGYGALSPGSSPYGNAGYSESSAAFIPSSQGATSKPKKGLSPWVKFGVPVAIVVIAGAVVAGIFLSKKNSSTSADGKGGLAGGKDASVDSKAPIATATDLLAAGRFATATNTKYLVPVYPSAVRLLFHALFLD